MAKSDGYKPPIATTGNVNIYTHNREQMAPGHATAAAYAPDESLTTQQVLDTASTQTLRGIFNDVATHDKTRAHDDGGQLIIFHAVDPDNEVEDFRKNMKDLIAPYTQKGAGGARIIIDERYNPTGFLTVHLIGGEQLGQQPDKTHRWFQKPKAPGA